MIRLTPDQELATWLYHRYSRHGHREGLSSTTTPKLLFSQLPEAQQRVLTAVARDVQELIRALRRSG